MNSFPTLCILAYERPELLQSTLGSLWDNTSEPFELIIHDDGSNPDDTNAFDHILDQARYDGATVIRNLPGWNQGQGVALNRMFGMAKGDVIFKLDADLEFTPGWLTKALDIVKYDSRIGLLGLTHYFHEPVDMRKTLVPDQIPNIHHAYHTHILGCAFAVPRFIWNMFGPFEEYSEAFAEDWSFQQKITNDTQFNCALPHEELVKSPNMGLGNSVVVQEDGSVHKIHKEPYIING